MGRKISAKGTPMRTRKLYLLPGLLCGLVFAFAITSPTARAQTTAPNEWTWMGGNNMIGDVCTQGVFCGRPGIYGTLGTPSGGNNPGGRYSGAAWTDNSGKLWLFGGGGFDSAGNNFFLNDLWKFDPASNEWTWVGGSNLVNQTGVYETIGVAAAASVPGARECAVTWTDANGRFWLFGGWGMDGHGEYSALSDLWEFDPSLGQWKWVSGNTFVNQPAVFGTLGVPAPANKPGGLYEAASWIDSSGRLWLFGGYGYDSNAVLGELNDLWRFDPSTNEWTWLGGNSAVGTYCVNGEFCGYVGVYGTMGTPSAGNIPGSRINPATWIDGAGNLWLAFGDGYDDTGAWGDFDDIWQFSPATNEWTWWGGYNTIGTNGRHAGVYGSLGTFSSNNLPGSRDSDSAWTDQSGHAWLFGGWGWDSLSNTGVLNDLWEFDASLNEWVWMGGSSTIGAYDGEGQSGWSGVYGIQGTPSAANLPGSRDSSMTWTGSDGRFWLFGGYGFDSTHAWGSLNDLWIYQPSSATFPVPDFSLAATPASSTVTAGQFGTTSISVTPANGFNSTVSFSCSGLPSGATCIFSPQTVTPSAGVASTTLNVTTDVSMAAIQRPAGPLFPVGALAALACCLGWKKRRLFPILPLIVVIAIGLSQLNGCSGANSGGVPSTPQSATYTITVNATSGSLAHSTSFSLTVN
jgi:N-acetylneuraminic acid mutarotase